MSAQCCVEDWRQGIQCVLRQCLCIALPLSLCEYNPFHSLRGRAENEPALSLPPLPLSLCISSLHMSPEQNQLSKPPPCRRQKPQLQRMVFPLTIATTPQFFLLFLFFCYYWNHCVRFCRSDFSEKSHHQSRRTVLKVSSLYELQECEKAILYFQC